MRWQSRRKRRKSIPGRVRGLAVPFCSQKPRGFATQNNDAELLTFYKCTRSFICATSLHVFACECVLYTCMCRMYFVCTDDLQSEEVSSVLGLHLHLSWF